MIVIAATKAWQPVKVTSDTELSLLKSKIAETKMQLKQEKAGSLQVDGGVSVTVTLASVDTGHHFLWWYHFEV